MARKPKPYRVLSRDTVLRMMEAGYSFTNASLYEPDHAPKGTSFAHVEYDRARNTHFMRIHPPKES